MRKAFTLPEILIAVSLFAVVTSIVGSLYIYSFRETRRANMQNQIYEDARFVMQQIANEIRSGTVDYDEYYNQNVVKNAYFDGDEALGIKGWDTYGQNFGRYYSSFFHPGSDEELGFLCNDGVTRNGRSCTPLRRTIDRNTGQNPFPGKHVGALADDEDAFCAEILYDAGGAFIGNRYGICDGDYPDENLERKHDELYLISADGRTKTILARERIGGENGGGEIFALSLLRLNGIDINNDNIADRFVCAPGFQCRGSDFDVEPNSVDALNITAADMSCYSEGGGTGTADLPRPSVIELAENETSCDDASVGFSKDFVPISPFRVNITSLAFYITPSEDPHFAFAEVGKQQQPRVTVALTVAQNSAVSGITESFEQITLVQTVSSRVLSPVSEPILVQ